MYVSKVEIKLAKMRNITTEQKFVHNIVPNIIDGKAEQLLPKIIG